MSARALARMDPDGRARYVVTDVVFGRNYLSWAGAYLSGTR